MTMNPNTEALLNEYRQRQETNAQKARQATELGQSEQQTKSGIGFLVDQLIVRLK